jgi:hypothetical protein
MKLQALLVLCASGDWEVAIIQNGQSWSKTTTFSGNISTTWSKF